MAQARCGGYCEPKVQRIVGLWQFKGQDRLHHCLALGNLGGDLAAWLGRRALPPR